MGEYAKTKKGREIKIGTCEMMYYIRHDQINQVDYKFDFDCYFRLQLESEKGIEAGDYKSHETNGIDIFNAGKFFTNEQIETLKPGIDQITNRCGLLINLPCFHGLKLPEFVGMKVFKNGCRPFFKVSYLFYKHDENKLYFAISCKCCNTMFTCDSSEAKEFDIPFENKEDFDNMIKYVEDFNGK